MKYLFIVYLLFLAACSAAQSTTEPNIRKDGAFVTFKVVNNSVLPHKYTFIGYNPGETGNWTNGFLILPGAAHTFKCVEGTKIYLANNKQIGIVMSGSSILRDEPFITVKAEDEGKAFRLKQ
ncbi:MAG TPA: hypothetical protein PLO67_01290 [Saprospiraceae bacterium]|nr:hypothetical protein [Saprospiraceae bacterium]HPI05783.1 hypothetical protein [Saprospiraceae bacterium]